MRWTGAIVGWMGSVTGMLQLLSRTGLSPVVSAEADGVDEAETNLGGHHVRDTNEEG